MAEPLNRPEEREDESLSHAFSGGMSEAAPYLGLGIEIMLSMVFFVVLGYFADRWLGTAPWLLIVGALLGFVAVGATLVKLVRELEARKGPPERPPG
ncbi:MAG: AtpZ/AtpI family protein, partial [Rhodothermales bacterium]|nr:AtpZ/AtpI family protein [Rhodothermales bacterium]